jgi:hypothetical protein
MVMEVTGKRGVCLGESAALSFITFFVWMLGLDRDWKYC